MESELSRLSESVFQARSLEELTRPLLEMLAMVTGFDSAYLTTIELTASIQSIRFSHNAGTLEIPEGLAVPWDDTLCKRSIDEGRTFTRDVPACWGDSSAAAALGIQTYVSTPIRASDGQLIGTLCAASRESLDLDHRAQGTLQLFSKLIAQHLERESLLKQLSVANASLSTHALTDFLTGLPNRRAIHDALSREFARAARGGSFVLVGLVDLDGFKAINDRYGHEAGDGFLQDIATRLSNVVRATDLVGRLGGDEFVLVAPASSDAGAAHAAARVLERRASEATKGTYVVQGADFDYAGASVGVIVCDGTVDSGKALQFADSAMYATKRTRKASDPDASGVRPR
jgi:diguanylate cyclase